MLRDVFTSKWVIGGFGFLIVFGIGCYFWYQHELAPYRQDTAETTKVARKLEATQKVDINSKVEQAAGKPAESTTPTIEKPLPQKIGTVAEHTETETQQQSETPVNTADVSEDVSKSPFGFGPYPKVPEDYPYRINWDNRDTPSAELLSRVLIKLWTEGEKDFRGGSTYKGLILPHYNDAVYVNWHEYKKSDGTIVRRATTKISGPRVNYGGIDFLNPPPHIRVLDLATSGIDPYQYLDLPYRKEKNDE
ncbi:hypothetical protein J4G08_14545 [Candidatus Poribacteria bacterium]|nr:hypothetical protein [Candidatus Poribacteria bacterium]